MRLTVARDVSVELALPELNPALRRVREPAAVVTVPETAVNEDHLPPARHSDVRAAWKSFPVKAVADTKSPKRAADGDLRGGVLSPDRGHVGASALSADSVGHGAGPEVHIVPRCRRADVAVKVARAGRFTVAGHEAYRATMSERDGAR